MKYKFINCKQSVEGSIISQILKLPYSNGDVNKMEIINKKRNITVYKSYQKQKKKNDLIWNTLYIYSNRLPHKYKQYWTAWGYIMQSRTILVLRLIPDKGRSKALPLFTAMRGISNNFLVHLPSWHDELRVCKEKQIKLLLMFQIVIRLEKTSNSESVSFPAWRLEIFCWGDMKKNLKQREVTTKRVISS